MKETFVAVELNNDDAELFKFFMKHYRSIKFMRDTGVFDITRGSATINFDKNGDLLSVDKHIYVYANEKH